MGDGSGEADQLLHRGGKLPEISQRRIKLARVIEQSHHPVAYCLDILFAADSAPTGKLIGVRMADLDGVAAKPARQKRRLAC
jgi:hypothetical protein